MKKFIFILISLQLIVLTGQPDCKAETTKHSPISSAIILLKHPLSEKELDQLVKTEPQLELEYRYQTIFSGISVKGSQRAIEKLEKDNRVLHIFPSTVYQLDFDIAQVKKDADRGFSTEPSRSSNQEGLRTIGEEKNLYLSTDPSEAFSKGIEYLGSDQYPNHFQWIGTDEVRRMTDEQGERLTGKGIKIGIIDTGIDYTHPDLFSNYEKGYDFVDHDNDPQEKDAGTIHGTHVAGIIAANGKMIGMAPDARLFVYRALGPGGRGTTEQILAAIEQAIKDRVDILNLSLGIQINGPDLPTSLALDAAVSRGIVAVVSSGNAGPELWTVGSPGTSQKAISVGASTPPLMIPYLAYRKSLFRLTPLNGLGKWDFHRSYPIIFEKDGGHKQDRPFVNSLVLLEKGSYNLSEKIEDLANRKVKGVILTGFSEEQLFTYGEEVGWNIPLPTYILSEEEGKTLKKIIEPKSIARLVWKREEDVLANFSSRGPVTSTWNMKPDLLAPGVSITSTVPGGYATLHGTSMAAPHVTGACALIKQAHPNWTPEQMKAALMNTSKPLMKKETYYRTFEQGAGRIQVDEALRTTTIVEPGAILFGKMTGKPFETKRRTFTVENVSQETIRYTFLPPKQEDTVVWDVPLSFYLKPGEKRKIDLSIHLKKTIETGGIYEGYIQMYADHQRLQIPYLYLIKEPNYPRLMFFAMENGKRKGWMRYEVYLPGGAEEFGIFLLNPFTNEIFHVFQAERGMKKGLSEGEVEFKNDMSPGDYLAIAYAKKAGKEDYLQQWLEIEGTKNR